MCLIRVEGGGLGVCVQCEAKAKAKVMGRGGCGLKYQSAVSKIVNGLGRDSKGLCEVLGGKQLCTRVWYVR